MTIQLHPDHPLAVAVVVLDGIDEAARLRSAVTRFVLEVLVPLGLRVVCTSRPEGVDFDDFKRFVLSEPTLA